MKITSIILSFLFALLLNRILSLSKTPYILVLSIFLFLVVGIFLFFLELEFIATAFIIIYVGGIAIIFIFLIIVLDSRSENMVNYAISFEWVKNSVIVSLLVTFFYKIILFYYSPLMFNSILFKQMQISTLYPFKAVSFYLSCLSSDLFQIINQPGGLLRYKLKLYYKSISMYDTWFDTAFYWFSDFQDLFILGSVAFKNFSVEITMVAVFLFLATIVAISMSSTIFKK